MNPRGHGQPGPGGAGGGGGHGPRPRRRGGLTPHRPTSTPAPRPPLDVFTTTLWTYPSQHYGNLGTQQGSAKYVGATPSWVIWQLLQRYTKRGDLVIDPMCGSGTTLDVARDLDRRGLGYDLNPQRPDIFRADARSLPLEAGKADFVFIDPPYSTHVNYSDDPRCIGKLDAGGADRGAAYYAAMEAVIAEIDRVLKPGGYLGLYVSDSFEKSGGGSGEAAGRSGKSPAGLFMPIGFELFAMMRARFAPVDIIAVVRGNQKLERSNWHAAAREGNFFLRGFNYLFIMFKPHAAAGTPAPARGGRPRP